MVVAVQQEAGLRTHFRPVVEAGQCWRTFSLAHTQRMTVLTASPLAAPLALFHLVGGGSISHLVPQDSLEGLPLLAALLVALAAMQACLVVAAVLHHQLLLLRHAVAHRHGGQELGLARSLVQAVQHRGQARLVQWEHRLLGGSVDRSSLLFLAVGGAAAAAAAAIVALLISASER